MCLYKDSSLEVIWSELVKVKEDGKVSEKMMENYNFLKK